MYFCRMMFLIVAAAAAINALPTTTRPPYQCPLVIPQSPAPAGTGCGSIDSLERATLKVKADNKLASISGTMDTINNTASCHPDFTILSLVERGSNTSIDPNVPTERTEIGRSVNYFDLCFEPALKDLTSTEEELFKHDESFQFYRQLNNATDEIVELIQTLRKLAKNDQELTEGTICSIPRVTCIVPYYPTTRANGDPLTDIQVRMQKLVNISTSLKRYVDNLRGIPNYWDQ